MKTTKSNLPTPILVDGDLKFQPEILKRGKFVYEGFGCNRALRYLCDKELTYEEVRGFIDIEAGKFKQDIRTHNVDLIRLSKDESRGMGMIRVENNKSQEVYVEYVTFEEAKQVYLYIVGEQFLNELDLS